MNDVVEPHSLENTQQTPKPKDLILIVHVKQKHILDNNAKVRFGILRVYSNIENANLLTLLRFILQNIKKFK